MGATTQAGIQYRRRGLQTLWWASKSPGLDRRSAENRPFINALGCERRLVNYDERVAVVSGPTVSWGVF